MRYTIKDSEGTALDSRSAKPAAIALADALAKEHKATLTVTTDAGTVVHTAKARKAQVSTPRLSRVDSRELELGEGVALPEGWDVAYARPRASLVTLRQVTDEGAEYLVFDVTTGASADAENTRDAGRIMREVKKGDLELAL